MAGPDRSAAVPGPLPRPLLRRRHRRAARRHRRRRHGDGRAAPDRGDLLDVPQPGLGPGRVRRRPAPPAGRVLHRPGRHHRSRRAEPPRRLRHGPARPGARACACWRRRAPRSCTRCCTTRWSSPTTARSPSATRGARPATSASTRSASASGPAAVRAAPATAADGRVHPRHRQARRGGREGRRRARRRSGVAVTVWDVRCCAPLDDDMLADAARHRAVVTVRGRHPRRRHRHDHRGPPSAHSTRPSRSRCSGCRRASSPTTAGPSGSSPSSASTPTESRPPPAGCSRRDACRSPLGPRPVHRRRGPHVGPRRWPTRRRWPERAERARLPALLGRRAPQHGDRRQHVAAGADGPPRAPRRRRSASARAA